MSGNITKSGYATNIQLTDGTWGDYPSTNFNDTAISSICGERSAVLSIFNKAIRNLSLKKLETNPNYKNEFQEKFKAKYVVMSSAKSIGTDLNAASPCSDCLSWFNSDKLFQDNTQIVFFDKNDSGKLCLKMRSLKEMLPFRNEKNSLIEGNKKLSELGIDIIPNAALAMVEKSISSEDVFKLVERAQSARESNKNTGFSKLNIASAVLTNNKKIKVGKKFDWTKRWFLEPAEIASNKAVEKSPGKNKIDAIAYYGNGVVVDEKGVKHADGVVSLQTLGRLKITHGSDSTLVISVVDNQIAVRTINDYMPKEFGFIHSYLK